MATSRLRERRRGAGHAQAFSELSIRHQKREHQPHTIRRSQPFVEAANVHSHRMHRETGMFSDGPVGVPVEKQLRDKQLARRQPENSTDLLEPLGPEVSRKPGIVEVELFVAQCFASWRRKNERTPK